MTAAAASCWRRWLRGGIAGLLAGGAVLASAQPADAPTQLSGTLAKARATGSIRIGYRDSAVPFSFLSPRGEPIGYSIDLCRAIVDAIGDEVGRQLAITWQPVSAASRIAAVTSGQIDLECGSTTSNLERQQQVAFSPTIFVSGTRLMVKTGSPIRSFADLVGKRVAVTSGTTNERAMRALSQKFRLDLDLLVAPDHEAGFGLLATGQVDAFATDDVLLSGLLALHNAKAAFVVTGDYLSYDPYGLMFRKADPNLARLVDDTFHRLAEDGEIERRYQRWFLQKLPSGLSLGLPMSPQLETLIQAMAVRNE